MNKRLLYVLSALAIQGLMVSACQPQVIEVEKEIVVTQVVKEEVQVEKVVEVEVEVEKVVEVERYIEKEVAVEKEVEVVVTATPSPFNLTIAVPSDVSTLDIHNETNTTLNPHYQIYDSLVMRDDNGDIQAGLAVSWEAIDDTTWEFKLREGVKFHNGEDFNADDVKFSLERIMNAAEGSGPRKQYSGWFDSVEVIDPYTVRIKTQTIFPVVLGNIARQHTIMPKDYVEDVGDEEAGKNPVGTGPFKFVEWNVNESVVLEPNDDYWGGRPAVDQLVFRVIPDETTRVAEMLTGGVDILLQVPPASIGELADSGIQVLTTSSVTNFYLGINVDEIDDVRVRQAMAHGLDIDAMSSAILGDTAVKASSLVQSTSFGWNPYIEPYEYNPEMALQLLADAGYPDGFDTTLDAAPLSLWPATTEAAEVIAAQLGEVGINVELNVGEFGDYFTRYREGTIKGLFLWGNAAATQDADTHMHLNFRCPPEGRGIYFCSELTDELILDARIELNESTRRKLYWDLQETLHKDVVAIPLWQYNVVAAINDRVDWQPRSDGLIYVNTLVPAR